MRLILYLLLFFTLLAPYTIYSQGGTWTWMNGSNHVYGSAVYGTKGVAAPNNTPPATYEGVNWTDLEGNLWFFGGYTDSGTYSDLWKYNTSDYMWTWVNGPGVANRPGKYGVKGIPSASNYPSGRYFGCLTWTDSSDNLWMYGGTGYDSTGMQGALADLWRYNISTNEWTWMNGPNLGENRIPNPTNYGTLGQPAAGNIPGWRYEDNSCWVDANNNLWFFGGNWNYDNYSDMWRYQTSSNEWAWMAGPQQSSLTGNYGVKGVEGALNYPPGRGSYTHWKDTAGNFYLFGGIQFDSIDWYSFNDVWKYNVTTNAWAWVAGDSSTGSLGYYSNDCIETPAIEPMSRFENRTPQMTAKTNRFVAFGGGYVANASLGGRSLPDLWLFDSNNDEWRCLDSNHVFSFAGNYGTYQVPSPTNHPSARYGQCEWTDNKGILWVFGGGIMYNDLWRFVPDCVCSNGGLISAAPPAYSLLSDTTCGADSASLTLLNMFNLSISPSGSVSTGDSVHFKFSPDSTTTYIITGQTAVCGAIDTITATVHIGSGAPIAIMASKTSFCSNDSVQLCAPAGYQNYEWSNFQSGRCIYTNQAGDYYVTASESSGCTVQSNHIVLNVLPVPTVSTSQSGDTLSVSGNYTCQWFKNGDSIVGANSNTFIAQSPGSYTVQVTDTSGCTAFSNAFIVSSLNDLRANEMEVYPNPSNNGIWHLRVTELVLKSDAKIYDARGSLISNFKVEGMDTDIHLPGAAGIYILKINWNGGSFVEKLVKM